MNAKITKSLIEDMKEYAKMHNTSVSKMVTKFFKSTLKKNKEISKNPNCKKISSTLLNF